ncbi:MAG TPA: TonB-dependent receptor [Terriglobales bacterium]|nr:TonB-dependent receptor [Terriglobales bacterium]
MPFRSLSKDNNNTPAFCLCCLYVCLLTALLVTLAAGQSMTTGDITGTVSDPSGAVVANVELILKSLDKGYTQTARTNAQGQYRFPLLSPGNYSISASAQGFKTVTVTQTVAVGSTSIANLKMEVGNTSTTVEVSAEAPLLQTDSSEITTSINTRAVQNLPNPGNDLSFIAQVAPGSTMNTQSGYGNFSSYGISATSNLFTINGMYDNDPFLNLNNSGATNLLLGNNEVQEATVVSNGYSGEYGGFAGATVNYVTKSGTNGWHGNASYWWNGSSMNANDWFNNNTTPKTPKGFDNANQYAASFGGPIKKDKAFFFFNYEGLRVVIPTNQTVSVPTPAFEAATLTHLGAIGQAAQVPFYKTMFSLYNAAPGINTATPVTASNNGCYDVAIDPVAPITSGCTQSWRSTQTNLTHEYLLAGRFDFNLTNSDKVFLRLQEDKGLQATYTDPINKLFNTQSNQPEYQGQASWTHTFGVKAVNNVIFSAAYYSAIFENADSAATLAAFPTTLLLADSSLTNTFEGTSLGGIDFIFPQGRNVTQYQVVDDFSYNLGAKHTLKLGLNFHRYDIGDHDFGLYNSGLLIPLSLDAFYNGGVPTTTTGPSGGTTGSILTQSFPASLAQPVSIYGLGWYLQDDFRATPTLKLTFTLRMDHPSNPVCQTNCFARFNAPFASLDKSASIPYNQSIVTGLHQAIPNFQTIVWNPRFGFAWTPPGLKNTVIRGGIGMFGDTFPGTVADNLSQNPPLDNTFTTAFAPMSPNWQATVPGNLFALASGSNTSFKNGFAAGQTLGQIEAANPFFAPPGFSNVSKVSIPTYEEWSLEAQQAVGVNTSIDLKYVGNHGYHESVLYNTLNSYCPTSVCPFGFAGLPAAPPDPRFNEVAEVGSHAVSNYNGLTASVTRRFAHGVQIQGSFTWSHAIDEISNGGFLPFNDTTNVNAIFPQNPFDLRGMYGNADYDTRLYGSMSYVWELPYKWGPRPLMQGWQLSGTLFTRSGLPYTVTDGGDSVTLQSYGYGATPNPGAILFANYSGAPQPNCGTGAASATPSGESRPCLTAADFTPVISSTGPSGFSTLRRNQSYGPGYFDTDMTIMKYTNIPHWEAGKLGLGVQFFNLFNHPNFDQPDRNISHTATFGQILRTVNTPTSILGSFLGGDASPRLIQLSAKFVF